MISREELESRYATLTNSELMNIIENKFDYTELAVIIALEEIARRNITEDDIKLIKEEQIEKTDTFIDRNIVDDLNIIQKILFFIIWVPLLNFPFKRNFHDYGYVLKLKQANYYSWLGFTFFMIVGIVSAFFDLTDLISLALWILSFIPVLIYDEYFNRQSQIRKLQRFFDKSNDEVSPLKPS